MNTNIITSQKEVQDLFDGYQVECETDEFFNRLTDEEKQDYLEFLNDIIEDQMVKLGITDTPSHHQEVQEYRDFLMEVQEQDFKLELLRGNYKELN